MEYVYIDVLSPPPLHHSDIYDGRYKYANLENESMCS